MLKPVPDMWLLEKPKLGSFTRADEFQIPRRPRSACPPAPPAKRWVFLALDRLDTADGPIAFPFCSLKLIQSAVE